MASTPSSTQEQNPRASFNQKCTRAPQYCGRPELRLRSSRSTPPRPSCAGAIHAIVGGAFACEIFSGTAYPRHSPSRRRPKPTSNGSRKAIERAPKDPVSVDLESQEVRLSFGARVNQGHRCPTSRARMLVAVTWEFHRGFSWKGGRGDRGYHRGNLP